MLVEFPWNLNPAQLWGICPRAAECARILRFTKNSALVDIASHCGESPLGRPEIPSSVIAALDHAQEILPTLLARNGVEGRLDAYSQHVGLILKIDFQCLPLPNWLARKIELKVDPDPTNTGFAPVPAFLREPI